MIIAQLSGKSHRHTYQNARITDLFENFDEFIEAIQKDALSDPLSADQEKMKHPEKSLTKKEIKGMIAASTPHHVGILLQALLILSHRMDKIQRLIADTHEIEDDLAPGESHMVAIARAIRREFGIKEGNWE